MKLGCIGETLRHSFSENIHNMLGYPYTLFSLPREQLSGFMRSACFDGINVTIPYKQAVMEYLDMIDKTAQRIGAVNTVVRRDGKLWGYNTDAAGLEMLICSLQAPVKGRNALVLGTGGTSRTAVYVLEKLGARSVRRVSRSGRDGAWTYEQAVQNGGDIEWIINTTPCGMYPDIFSRPVDLRHFPKLEGLVDAVYNPLRTQLVLQARGMGIPARGGLFMLTAQALYASRLFTGNEDTLSRLDGIYRALHTQKENIVLIGMPGSGKTTVGRVLAQLTGRRFADTDETVTEMTGQKPETIIRSEGEEAFREAEMKAVRTCAKQSGAVIATGGGTVLRPENVTALRMNGRLYFLDRPPERIVPTASRPLSSTPEMLLQRYRERLPVYLSACDTRIVPCNTQRETAMRILEDFGL